MSLSITPAARPAEAAVRADALFIHEGRASLEQLLAE